MADSFTFGGQAAGMPRFEQDELYRMVDMIRQAIVRHGIVKQENADIWLNHEGNYFVLDMEHGSAATAPIYASITRGKVISLTIGNSVETTEKLKEEIRKSYKDAIFG